MMQSHISVLDVLQTVVTNMRLAMEEKGCQFLFHTKMTKF